MVGAHRRSWEMHYGAVPEGMYVCHKCDVRNCVNPLHLYVGTHTDNMRDKRVRGRASRLRGSSNPSSVMSECDVVTVKKMLANGVRGTEIAKRFGVSPSAICLINRGKKWKHVPEAKS